MFAGYELRNIFSNVEDDMRINADLSMFPRQVISMNADTHTLTEIISVSHSCTYRKRRDAVYSEDIFVKHSLLSGNPSTSRDDYLTLRIFTWWDV